MDWASVEGVIGRLEACTQGRRVDVPGNAEILSAFAFLDRHLPEKDARYLALVQTLAAPTLRLNRELAADLRLLFERLRLHREQDQRMAERIVYVPNRIPPAERQRNLFFACSLLAYSAFLAWMGDYFVPLGKRGGLHLHGSPLWVMEAATLCAVVVLLAVVVDHYDRRPNERMYEDVGRGFRNFGWVLFGLAVLAQLVSYFYR